MKLIHNYECEGRPLDELSEEDRFMVRFGKIPRLSQRISTLTFMGNFPESVQLIQPVSSPRETGVRQEESSPSETTWSRCRLPPGSSPLIKGCFTREILLIHY